MFPTLNEKIKYVRHFHVQVVFSLKDVPFLQLTINIMVFLKNIYLHYELDVFIEKKTNNLKFVLVIFNFVN